MAKTSETSVLIEKNDMGEGTCHLHGEGPHQLTPSVRTMAKTNETSILVEKDDMGDGICHLQGEAPTVDSIRQNHGKDQ